MKIRKQEIKRGKLKRKGYKIDKNKTKIKGK